jgi:hypothetical protein
MYENLAVVAQLRRAKNTKSFKERVLSTQHSMA